MFEEENQIENQAEKQVENQENKIDLEKKAGETAVVKRRLLTRRRRKEDIPAPQASSPAASSSAAPAANPVPESTEGRSKMIINELTQLGLLELRQKALEMGIPHENLGSLKKQDLIFQILKAHTAGGGIIYSYGSLEILSEGFGFLRSRRTAICRVQMIFIFHHPRSGFSTLRPATLYQARYGLRKRERNILPCCG